jgi:hypothetical protein
MKTTSPRKRFVSLVLLLSLTWTLCLWSTDRGWAQDKAAVAADASPQTDNFLDLRGDVPNPQRIDIVALQKLPQLTDRIVLLADAMDGQPLSAHEGPFRIIVPKEKRAARWVRQVKSVTVRKN